MMVSFDVSIDIEPPVCASAEFAESVRSMHVLVPQVVVFAVGRLAPLFKHADNTSPPAAASPIVSRKLRREQLDPNCATYFLAMMNRPAA